MPSFMVHTLSQMNKTPLDVRRSVIFYAPLRHYLEYIGVEPITFTRSSSAMARWRDGFYHSVGNNIPRFEYDETGVNELGLLWEPARENKCLYSEDFSNAAWAKTTITVGANDSGTTDPKGSTTADLLTATGGNSTAIQDLGAISSSSKVFTVYLKRKTGSGLIQLTLDGGSTWTTVSTNSVSWTRAQLIQTVANPDAGIRIVTSGDEVWAWGAQVEDNVAEASSYVATTSAAVTRSADVFGYPITNPIASSVKTLIWVENGVSKVNHLDGVPFDGATGLWIGTTIPTYIKEIVGFDRTLTAQEIAKVRSELTGDIVPVVPITPPGATIVPFSQAVTLGSLSAVITHNIGNAGHKIFATPNWSTSVSWSNKQANSTTLNFTVAAVSGAVIEGSVEL